MGQRCVTAMQRKPQPDSIDLNGSADPCEDSGCLSDTTTALNRTSSVAPPVERSTVTPTRAAHSVVQQSTQRPNAATTTATATPLATRSDAATAPPAQGILPTHLPLPTAAGIFAPALTTMHGVPPGADANVDGEWPPVVLSFTATLNATIQRERERQRCLETTAAAAGRAARTRRASPPPSVTSPSRRRHRIGTTTTTTTAVDVPSSRITASRISSTVTPNVKVGRQRSRNRRCTSPGTGQGPPLYGGAAVNPLGGRPVAPTVRIVVSPPKHQRSATVDTSLSLALHQPETSWGPSQRINRVLSPPPGTWLYCDVDGGDDEQTSPLGRLCAHQPTGWGR